MKTSIKVMTASIILFWLALFGLLGQLLNLLVPGIIAGLCVGGGLAILGEWIDNWLARCLTVILVLGAILGAVISFFIAVGFSGNVAAILVDQESAAPGANGYFQILVGAGMTIVGTVAISLLMGVIGLIGSLIIRQQSAYASQPSISSGSKSDGCSG